MSTQFTKLYPECPAPAITLHVMFLKVELFIQPWDFIRSILMYKLTRISSFWPRRLIAAINLFNDYA
jgi:hypothetical protein